MQVSGYYDQTADVTTAQIPNLPANALGSWMAAKAPTIWKAQTAADQVGILSLGLPGFVGAGDVKRMTPDPNAAPSTTEGPPLVPKSDGSIWLVSNSAGSAAKDRLWQMLMDPGYLRPLKSPSYKTAPGRPVARIMRRSARAPRGLLLVPSCLVVFLAACASNAPSGGGAGRGGTTGSAGSNGLGGTTGAAGTGSGNTTGNAGTGVSGNGGSGTAGTTGVGGTAPTTGLAGSGAQGGATAGTTGTAGTRRHWAGRNGRRGNPHLHDAGADGNGVCRRCDGRDLHAFGGTHARSVCKDDIIRIQYANGTSIPAKTSLSVNATWPAPTFCVSEAAGVLTVATARLKVKVVEATGVATFTDPKDNVILAEDSKTLTANTVEGVSTLKVQTVFNSPATEALYGLGQHQDSAMNLKGVTQHIENVNTQSTCRCWCRTRATAFSGTNYSKSDFTGNDTNGTKYKYVSEAGDFVDYYFFYGPSIDHVIRSTARPRARLPCSPSGPMACSSPRTTTRARPS